MNGTASSARRNDNHAAVGSPPTNLGGIFGQQQQHNGLMGGTISTQRRDRQIEADEKYARELEAAELKSLQLLKNAISLDPEEGPVDDTRNQRGVQTFAGSSSTNQKTAAKGEKGGSGYNGDTTSDEDDDPGSHQEVSATKRSTQTTSTGQIILYQGRTGYIVLLPKETS